MADTEVATSSNTEPTTKPEAEAAPAEKKQCKDGEVAVDAKEKTEDSKEAASDATEKGEETAVDGKEKLVDAKDAEKWFVQGKRNLVCGEVPLAVQQLQEACRLLAEKHGETAKECGEAYLCYGAALLDLSRMESGVLGNALQGIDEESSQDEDEKSEKSEEKSEASEQFEDPSKLTEEEREKLAEQVYDAMAEREEEKKKADGEEKMEDNENKENEAPVPADGKVDAKSESDAKDKEKAAGDAKEEKSEEKADTTEKKDEMMDSSEKKEEESAEKKDGDNEMETDVKEEEKKKEDEAEGTEEEGTEEEGEEVTEEDEAGTSQDEGESTEDKTEEDVSNLQLAWEMLELAKLIFNKEETKESRLKVAESHLKLGEVGLETESYEQSVSDFESCLKIQTELLDKDDRKIAETYYQLGLAFNFNGKHDEAISKFKMAAEVIETKIASLTKVIEEAESAGKGKESASADDPVVAAQKEVNDLKELLPDMINKIKDTEEEKANEEKVKQMVKENVTSELASAVNAFGTAAPAGSPTKQAQDITHLVRKKRKPEEEAVPEAGDAEAKKPRQETSEETEKTEKTVEKKSEPMVDGSGDAKPTNGQMNGKQASPEKNGTNGDKPAEEKPAEITTKTVEDVKKLTEEPMETEGEKAS